MNKGCITDLELVWWGHCKAPFPSYQPLQRSLCCCGHQSWSCGCGCSCSCCCAHLELGKIGRLILEEKEQCEFSVNVFICIFRFCQIDNWGRVSTSLDDQCSCCIQTSVHEAEAVVIRLVFEKHFEVRQVGPIQPLALTQLSNFGTLVIGITRDRSNLTPSWNQESSQTKLTLDQGCFDTSDRGLDKSARVWGIVTNVRYKVGKRVILTRQLQPGWSTRLTSGQVWSRGERLCVVEVT